MAWLGSALPCTLDAGRDGRIVFEPGRRDLIAAFKAVAEFVFVDAPQRGIDGGAFGLPAPRLGKSHRLDLHRVDARKPTHAILIPSHGCAVGLRHLVLGEKRSEEHKTELQTLKSDTNA